MTAVIVALLVGFLLLPVVLFELPYQWGRWKRHRRRLKTLAPWADNRSAATLGREVSHPSKEFPYQVRDLTSGGHVGRLDPFGGRRINRDPPPPPGASGGDGA